jgi:homoaconitate hydratase family protein/3-isopropylmalate dehydratase small subunit
MSGKTFVEKIFRAEAGTIVFARPDIILSHDNTASIIKIFTKMGGDEIADPNQLFIALDHNAPPTTSKLANDYQQIRNFVAKHKVFRFHDAGDGICHQLLADYARPGMIIVGSDSHTCTAGAFNAFAAGIDRTETAGLWKNGETWFRVPETIKITLNGELPKGIYAKDIALYIMGIIGSSGADYMSIEYHGDGVQTLSIEDRMTIANLASEMGAKNAVFPPDAIVNEFLYNNSKGIRADKDAQYKMEIKINLDELYPVVACPNHVDNIRSVDELAGQKIEQALIGTCTNGRIEDLRVAAKILKDKKVSPGVQLLVSPASKKIYLQAMKEGLLEIFLKAGANILSPSCGPCLGTGQGIPADGYTVISTANRNFLGRMGNKNAFIYLASPATVAHSAIKGEITSSLKGNNIYPYKKKLAKTVEIPPGENRKYGNVWDYHDLDSLNTDQMFAGNLTYEINSSEPEKIVPHLFRGFDNNFADQVERGDILICGENFGCGSSREHPSVGLAYKGIKAVIVKSVSRIFYRSAINQGLLVFVSPEVVESYYAGDNVIVNLEKSKITIGNKTYSIQSMPDKLMEIISAGGLVKWIKYKNA